MSDTHLTVSSEPIQQYIRLFISLKGLIDEANKEKFSYVLKLLSARTYAEVDRAVRETIVDVANDYGVRAFSRMNKIEPFKEDTFRMYIDAVMQLGELLRDWQMTPQTYGYLTVFEMLSEADLQKTLMAIRGSSVTSSIED